MAMAFNTKTIKCKYFTLRDRLSQQQRWTGWQM